MEIGIDSFAKKTQTNEGGTVQDDARAMSELIERIVHADKVGLDVFGLGEHHREEFLDSAAHNILSAAAAKTENIRLTSAVAVISAMDPVRLFQNYATLDLISNVGTLSSIIFLLLILENFLANKDLPDFLGPSIKTYF